MPKILTECFFHIYHCSEETKTKWQDKYGIMTKNINNQVEFLGYFFSLKNDYDLKKQQLKICTEILKNNLNRGKQLPITLRL